MIRKFVWKQHWGYCEVGVGRLHDGTVFEVLQPIFHHGDGR